MSRTEGTRGVKKTLYESALKSKDYNGRVLYELNSEEDFFKVSIEKEALKEGTKHKDTSVDRVKWLIIKEDIWDMYKNIYGQMSHLEFWNILKEELILANDYYVLEGKDQVISVLTIENKLANTGDIYLVIPFLFYPDKKLADVCFVSAGKGEVISAHFVLDVFKSTPLDTKDKIVHYGSTITIEVNTLLLPDYRKHGVKYAFEIDLYDYRYNPAPVIYTYKDLEIEVKNIDYLYKRSKRFTLPLPIELRKNQRPSSEMRYVTFAIRGKEVSTETTLEEAGKILYRTETGYFSKGKEIKWRELKDGVLGFNTSSEIFIPYDTYAGILAEREFQKNETIQRIGDIEFSQKNNDPCSYSKIKIKCEDQEKYIFDETEEVLDLTKTSYFDIISGTDPKDIIISVEKLRTPPSFIKNDECKGVLLADNQKHDKWRNIFQMGSVLPSYTDGVGNRTADEGFRIKSEKPIQNVAAIQGLEFNKDYFQDGDSAIRLQLGYIYDKTVRDGKWGGNLLITDMTFWMFNYFWLTTDYAQTYFVPISTCRYPNQLAKIRLFPDIEWEIAFLVTLLPGFSGKIRYERGSVNAIHRDYSFTYIQKDLSIETKAEGELGWSIEGKCSIDGKPTSVSFKKVEQTIDAVINTYNKSKKVLAMLDHEGGNFSNSAALRKKVIELDFAIDPPNIGFALSQKFGPASNGVIVPCYKGGFKADPLIGITISVDLVPIINKIPYLGPILKWIIKVIESFSNSDIYITVSIGLAVSCDLSLTFNEIDGFAKEQEWRGEIPLTLAAGAKSNDVVLIPTVTTGGRIENTEQEKWKVEGAASTSITFTKVYGYDYKAKKQYESSKGVWNGAKITITCYELVSSKTTVKGNQQKEFTIFDEKELYNNEKEYV